MNTRRAFTKCLLSAVFSLACCITAHAQLSLVSESYTTSEGLSDNSALCALRDSYGFLWVGTENGLNFFDGLRIRVFRDMVAFDNPNETNAIMSLYEHKGDIWFGGSEGLYVYHRRQNRYSRFSKKTRYGVIISSAVTKVMDSDDGMIWILTYGQGIFNYNPKTDELTQDSRHGSFFSDMIVGADGLVYAVTLNAKLVVFRADGQYVHSYDIQDSQFNKNPINITELEGDLWLASNTRLMRLNKDKKTTELVLDTPEMGSIHDITTDSKGHLFFGSDNGVYQYDLRNSHLEHIGQSGSTGKSLSDNMVNALMWDKDSTLLVLTRSGGLNVISMLQSGVEYIPLPLSTSSFETNFVRAMCHTPEGLLWLGTDKGLYSADYQKKTITPFASGKIPYELTALMLNGNDLWIGTRHNGLFILNTQTGSLTNHTFSDSQPYTIPSNEVNSIYRTHEGDIYVLTSWGLSRYDSENAHFYGYASISAMSSFVCMEQASNGWLWASSSNRGLFVKRGATMSFDPFKSQTIGRQTVTVMYSDSQGILWAATNSGGLYRFDPKKGDFTRADSEGTILRDQVISFIEEDDKNVLWLGTSAGILRMGPSRDADNVQVYGFSQAANYYQLQRSSCAHGHGFVLFGCNGGLFKLNTREMTPYANLQRVYISGITFPYASDSRAESQRLGLDVPLYTRESITMPYSDNSFTLHFQSTHYNGMSAAQFEYMLEGFDKTWVQGTTTPEATYANLAPGDYVFLLRSLGQTEESKTARLHITVLSPWYRTTLAYVIYAIAIIALLTGIYHLTQFRLKRRYQRQMLDFKQEQEKETFQSKIRFFIDLVHEIRTPLTLMSLPLEAINDEVKESKEDSTIKKHLTSIRRNMNYLLGITNQLLDFQKQENGGITLVRRNTDMGQMLQQIYDQFSNAVEVQGKQIQLQLPEDPVVLSMDYDKMMKVMMNLVGNAAKYSKEEIIVRLDQTDKEARISVIDDGPGVPAEELEHIFDRYYQIGKDSVAATLGTGLGLAYAKMLAKAHDGDLAYMDAPGGGSCFVLTVPLTLEASEEAEPVMMASPEMTEEPELVETGAPTHRILLVEDNEELLKATADALRKWYKVVKAHDGLEALELLKYQDVDVIVSDVMMPRMDGNELCRKLKGDLATSHTPVILLTAKVSVEAKVEGMESGADIYLEKPFSIRQLRLQIENLLRLRQQFYERMRSIDGFMVPQQESKEAPLGLSHQDLLFIEHLQKSVEENIHDEEFSIDTLAEQLNMSRSSFYRKIKALTGITPTDYLKTARMNKAANLLKEGCRSSEVAERVGFTSSSYFAKCFRAQFGCLPKDYAAQ